MYSKHSQKKRQIYCSQWELTRSGEKTENFCKKNKEYESISVIESGAIAATSFCIRIFYLDNRRSANLPGTFCQSSLFQKIKKPDKKLNLSGVLK